MGPFWEPFPNRDTPVQQYVVHVSIQQQRPPEPTGAKKETKKKQEHVRSIIFPKIVSSITRKHSIHSNAPPCSSSSLPVLILSISKKKTRQQQRDIRLARAAVTCCGNTKKETWLLVYEKCSRVLSYPRAERHSSHLQQGTTETKTKTVVFATRQRQTRNIW